MSRVSQILGFLCVSMGAACDGPSELEQHIARRAKGTGQGAAGAMAASVANPVTSAEQATPPPAVPARAATTPPVATPPVATPPVATPPVATPPVATPPVATPPVATPPAATPPASPATTTPPPETCAALKSCCADLDDPNDQEQCDEYASNADETECSEALELVCPDDAEPTDPEREDTEDVTCRELQACCADLDNEDDQEQCEQVVEEDDSDACAEAGTDFCT